MNNVTIIRERPHIENGWVLRADTLRFGKSEIMCEGNYYDCLRYWKRQFKNPLVESIKAYINGFNAEYGVYLNEIVTLHRNGYEEHITFYDEEE